MRGAGGGHTPSVGGVPVVGSGQRLRVGVARLPTEQPLRPGDVDVRVAVRGLVVPFGQRRQVRDLERPEGELGGTRGHRAQRAVGMGVLDQGFQIRPHRSEVRRADVQRLAGYGFRACEQDGFGEVVDVEQLVAVRAVAQDRDAPALADPVEEDLEDAEPFRAEKRLGSKDHDLGAVGGERAGDLLRLDLRAAVVADAFERRVFDHRVRLRHAVDRGRGDDDRARDAGTERRLEDSLRALDVDGRDLARRAADRQGRGGMDDDVGAARETPGGRGVADVSTNLLDHLLELGRVERSDVERANLVSGCEEPSREVQPEESRASGDRPEHAKTILARSRHGPVGSSAIRSTRVAGGPLIPTRVGPRACVY